MHEDDTHPHPPSVSAGSEDATLRSDSPSPSASSPTSEDLTADANPRLAARLFVLPAIVTGVILLALGLYFAVGALTRETVSADSYLEDVRIGRGNRRWQAAYELSTLLERGEAKVHEGSPALALKAFQDAREDKEDPRVRRYLALALGRMKNPAAVPDLAKALADPDAQTRIYVALALGLIADRRATPGLIAALSDEDPGVRKSSAYALGSLMDPASTEVLREALHDPQVDVTWNAAVALARMGDPSGAEVLRSMADRDFVERASLSEDPATRSTVLITAAQGLVMIEDTQALAALRKLAEADPDLRVRQSAIEALAKLAALTSKGARVQ